MPAMQIRPFTAGDEKAVIELWQKCGLTRPWNDTLRDIERKLAVNPELFLIGLMDGKVIATAMGGYEGHRGWVNYLAVDPSLRRQGLGHEMMKAIEQLLLERGCPKLNLQVRTGNTEAIGFYKAIGYNMDEVISMGKRLIEDKSGQVNL
jgi:ribosomal protein S18 acetylase RimI-like enzyme